MAQEIRIVMDGIHKRLALVNVSEESKEEVEQTQEEPKNEEIKPKRGRLKRVQEE
jgi:hypothetical protein